MTILSDHSFFLPFILVCLAVISSYHVVLGSIVNVFDDKKPTIRAVKWCFKKAISTELDDNKWLYVEMLGNCNIDLMCMQDFMKAVSQNTTQSYMQIAPYLEPGTAYFLPVDKDTPHTWLMADALNTMSSYNKDPKDFILVHISDETKPPHTGLSAVYSKFKKVIRNFWWDEQHFLDYRKQGHLQWYPLGYLTVPRNSAKTSSSKEFAIVPSNQRTHNLTFLGNKFGNFRRTWHLSEVTKATNLAIHGEVRAHGFRVGKSESYMYDMLNSKFCLNIRGRMSECYRFYEALEMGCIPVIIDRYPSYDYTSDHHQQYSPLKEVPWRLGTGVLPFIWVNDLNEFAVITKRLLGSGSDSALLQMQQDCMEWWQAVKAFYRKLFTENVCLTPARKASHL